jgi:hypothetical protein
VSEISAGQHARQMLERQLAALSSLYNAGVRSPNFREWRQATLTCIQRIWPAEPARPERFRRIPFSPPMGRPAEREVREYYERGCGEAGSLLKDYIAEIASVGLPSAAAPSVTPAGAPPAPGTNDDDFPTVDLPGPGGGAGSAASPPRPRLKDLLGFSEATHPTPPAPNAAAAGPPPAAAAPAPPPAAPPAGPGAVEQAMAELESHGFFAPPGHLIREAPAPAPPATPAEPVASAPAPQPRIVVTGMQPPATPPPPPVAAPAPPVAHPPAPPAPATADHVDAEDLGRVAEELLRASSALSSLPRRGTQDRRGSPREIRSPIPLAIAALALEVEAMGVPEGHRSRARAVLLDLSRRLDSPNLSWDALREAMTFVMEFPSLGRRMVPLLLPYLDRAA